MNLAKIYLKIIPQKKTKKRSKISYLLGYNALSACTRLHSGILFSLFYSEDGGDIFLRNVISLSTHYTTSYLRR
jgi:hypothetical protein